MDRPLERVAVIGTGTIGTQIAMLAANAGYSVKGYDVREGALDAILETIKGLDKIIPRENWPECRKRIQPVTSLDEALVDAELVIEAVPEVLEYKRQIWVELGEKTPPDAILASNSSSIPVSRIEDSGGRHEKSLNIHFYLGMAMADVMEGTRTDKQVVDIGVEWVRSLNLIPLRVKKELMGFCFNRVWRAIKREVLWMWAEGYADFKDIDRAWMIFNGMKDPATAFGPFSFMDEIGLDVIYNIEMVYYNDSKDPRDKPPQALKDKIDRGELGVKTGKGFYTHPNPEYRDPDFS